MKRLNRFLLLTGFVAIGLAGCGDDVTVVDPPPPPPPPTPQVRSLTVTPSNVNVSPSDKVVMTANVTADAGATPTIAWSTSDPARVTLSATSGASITVTIVANAAPGPVSINATATCATACGTASGAATLTIVSATANAPTVSIGGITTPAGATVPLGAAAGQMQANINLDRQGQIVSKLELLATTATDTIVLNVPGIGAPQAARGDGDPASAVEVITAPFNSAAFSCTATACTPMLFNQAYTLVVRVTWGANNAIRTGGNTAITFANASGFNVTATVAGAPVIDANGLTWQGGNLTIQAQGVIYTPGSLTISQVTVRPGTSQLPAGQLVAKTITAANGTATWASGTSIAGGGSRAYETLATNGPDCVTILGSSLSNGQPGPTAVINRSALCGGPVNSATPDNFMIDNRNPAGGTLVLTEQGTVNNASTSPSCCFLNWIGAAYTPASGHTNAAGSAGAAAGGVSPSDLGSGIGGVKYYAGAPTAISAGALGISAGTAFTKGSDLADSPQFPGNASLTIVAEVKDVVGNTTLVPLSPSANNVNPVTTIGVDNNAPTGTALAPGAATGNRAVALGAFPAGFTFTQTATDALSGFGTLQAQRRIYHNYFANGQAAGGVAGFGTVSTSSGNWIARIGNFAQTIAAAPGQGVGYYTDEVQARDKGGNLDPNLVVQELLWDGAQPTVQNVTASPQNTGALLSGQIATQYAWQAFDDVDLMATAAFLNAATGIGNGYLHRGNGSFAGQWGLPLDKQASALVSDVIIRSFSLAPNAVGFVPNQVRGVAMDVAGQAAGFNFVPLNVAAAAVPNTAQTGWGVTAVNLTAPGTFGFVLCSGNGGPCPVGTPSSVTLTLSAPGVGVTQNPGYANVPFLFTELHGVDPTRPVNGVQAWMITRTSVANAGVGLYTWSLTIDATQLAPTGGNVPFFAVGLTPDGDMVRSNVLLINVL